MNTIEKYNTFLQENDIRTFEELYYELDEGSYCEIEISIDGDLAMISVISEEEPGKDITTIFNGLIINKLDIKQIVCYSGPVTSYIEKEDINTLFDFKLKNLKFYPIEDGEVVRLFNYNSEWILSTFSKINADEQKSSESDEISIKGLFESCCRNMNFDYTKLDKQYVYVFGVYHQLNRCIIKHEINKLVHLDTYNNNFDKVNKNIGLGIAAEITFKNSLNLTQVCTYSKYTTPGFVIHNTENDKKYKLLTDKFLYVSLIKGEETDPVKNFIELNRDDLLEEFLIYFKDDEEFYRVMDEMFKSYVEYFYSSYVKSKIHRTQKPDEEYKIYEKEIINEIHQIYITTRINTSKEAVAMILKHFDINKLHEILTECSPST